MIKKIEIYIGIKRVYYDACFHGIVSVLVVFIYYLSMHIFNLFVYIIFWKLLLVINL